MPDDYKLGPVNDAPILDSADYVFPMEITNAISLGRIELPVWIKCGNSKFRVDIATQRAFCLGVLFATSMRLKSKPE